MSLKTTKNRQTVHSKNPKTLWGIHTDSATVCRIQIESV